VNQHLNEVLETLRSAQFDSDAVEQVNDKLNEDWVASILNEHGIQVSPRSKSITTKLPQLIDAIDDIVRRMMNG
jgi:protein-tyrosine-phosphatase